MSVIPVDCATIIAANAHPYPDLGHTEELIYPAADQMLNKRLRVKKSPIAVPTNNADNGNSSIPSSTDLFLALAISETKAALIAGAVRIKPMIAPL